MADVPLGETDHFDVVTSDPSTGSVSDADSAPTFDVFEEDTDTPILASQSMTKRGALTGNYRGAVLASSGNGFEAGKWYSVVATATVGGVTGKDVVRAFRVVAAELTAGVPRADVSHWAGSAASATDTALADAPPNFSALAINASGHVSRVTLVDALTGYAAPLDAAATRAAVGLASANLDTQLAAIKADTAAVLDDTGNAGVVVAAASKSGYSLAAAGLDAVAVESGLNARQALSVIASASAGVLAGAATATVTIAAAGVPATTRLTASVDESGNRTAVTLSPPA